MYIQLLEIDEIMVNDTSDLQIAMNKILHIEQRLR